METGNNGCCCCWVCRKLLNLNCSKQISTSDIGELLKSCVTSNKSVEEVCEECFLLCDKVVGLNFQLKNIQQAIDKIKAELKVRVAKGQSNIGSSQIRNTPSLKDDTTGFELHSESPSVKENKETQIKSEPPVEVVEVKEEETEYSNEDLETEFYFMEVSCTEDELSGEESEVFNNEEDEVVVEEFVEDSNKEEEDCVALDDFNDPTEFIHELISISDSEDEETPQPKKSKLSVKNPPKKKKPFKLTRLATLKESKCELCHPSEMYPSTVALSRHYEMDHRDTEKVFFCETFGCDEKLLTFELLELHKRCHFLNGRSMTGAPMFHRAFCSACRFHSYFPDELRRHELQEHLELMEYSCGSCGLKYFTQEVLEVHKRTHSTGAQRLVCLLCPDEWLWEYSDAQELESHLIRMHNFPFEYLRRFSKDSVIKSHLTEEQNESTCDTCDKMFPSNVRHNCEGREQTLRFQCELCARIFRHKVDLLAHTVSQHEKNTSQLQADLKCSKCGKQFASTLMYKRHWNCHNLESRLPFYCEVCEVSFPTDSLLSDHKTAQHNPLGNSRNRLSVCVVCEKRFYSVLQLRIHESKEHPELLTFECSNCTARFTKEEFLEVHLKTHDPSGPYLCSMCPSTSYPSGTALEDHLKTRHTVGSIKTCPNCGETFSRRLDLSKHLFHDHGVSLPYACSICRRSFSSNDTLKSHISRVHLSEEERRKKRMEDRVQCKICGKMFSKTSLSGHMQAIHEKSNGQLCETCGKSIGKESMKDHMKIHRGEKNFACDFCDKRFVRRDALRMHTYTHTGEKPFGCYICDKRFNQRTPRKRHIEIHKKDGSWFPKLD